MDSDQALRCRISGPLPYLWIGVLLVITLIGTPLLLVGMIRGGADGPPPAFGVTWLASMLWLWYVGLVWIAYEIRLRPGGEMEFKSVLRTVKIDARDLSYIGPAMGGLDPYTLVFRTPQRTARAPRHMSGFHRVLSQVLALNPAIELRGL